MRLLVECLQLCEHHVPQLDAHWYHVALFFLNLFSISFGLFSSSSLLESEDLGIVLPHVIVYHLYLCQDDMVEFSPLRTRDQ